MASDFEYRVTCLAGTDHVINPCLSCLQLVGAPLPTDRAGAR